MKNKKHRKRWLQTGFILGVLLFLIGTLDPLEGSVLILIGSLLLSIVTRMFRDPHHKWYRLAAILIFLGVLALWVLSALGGIGAESDLGYGWGLLIVPYPVGWLMLLVLFYMRLFVRNIKT